MKEVIRYEANDGKLFDTKEECARHETIIDIVTYLKENAVYNEDEMSYEAVLTLLLQKYNITLK